MTRKKKKYTNAKLSVLGNQYAQVMGYKYISKGVWRSLTGGVYTALKIGRQLPDLNFIADGNILNIMEIRRVNGAFPKQNKGE